MAMVLSVLVARKLARPFVRVAAAANKVGDMTLEEIEDLPTSRIREIDDQARAFNGMVRALRWLEIYVPRRLARRLLETTGGTVSSQDAEVTVMFTDIAGFTAWSEDRDAPAVADFLNHHFAIVGQGIDATDGTIDKFIGDAAMAFWGAPERQDDHAMRAVRAARLIAEAVAAENAARGADVAPLRMRIGIHCGKVTVGNIGAPDRMNYTIVGDTVNVCQRLEQAGKDLARQAEASEAVVIIVSESIARQLPESEAAALTPIGEITLRGRAEPIRAFRLDRSALTIAARAGRTSNDGWLAFRSGSLTHEPLVEALLCGIGALQKFYETGKRHQPRRVSIPEQEGAMRRRNSGPVVRAWPAP